MKFSFRKITLTTPGFQELEVAVRVGDSYLVGRTAIFSPEADGRPDYSLEEPPPVPFKPRGRLHRMMGWRSAAAG